MIQNFPELGKSRRRAFLGERPGDGVVTFDPCVSNRADSDSVWNAKRKYQTSGCRTGIDVGMENLRCLDFDRGDSPLWLAAFSRLASWCEAEISNADIADVVRGLLLLTWGLGRAPRPKEQRHPTFCSPRTSNRLAFGASQDTATGHN